MRAVYAIAALAMLANACRGDFHGSGEAESSSSEAGDGDGESGDGDGDGDGESSSGDGDGDGDGESSSGDGDGDGDGDGEDWALHFDGDDQAYTAPVDVSLGPSFTLELWLSVSDEPYYGVLLDTRAEGVTDVGWTFYVDAPTGMFTDRLVVFYLGASGDHFSVGPNVAGLSEGWHHIAVTRSAAGEITFWVDGDGTTGSPVNEDPGDGEASVLVGRQYIDGPESDLWWRGAPLDDIHVARSVLYDAPFAPQAPVVDPSSLFLWSFDEGAGKATQDAVDQVTLDLEGPLWVSGK